MCCFFFLFSTGRLWELGLGSFTDSFYCFSLFGEMGMGFAIKGGAFSVDNGLLPLYT